MEVERVISMEPVKVDAINSIVERASTISFLETLHTQQSRVGLGNLLLMDAQNPCLNQRSRHFEVPLLPNHRLDQRQWDVQWLHSGLEVGGFALFQDTVPLV